MPDLGYGHFGLWAVIIIASSVICGGTVYLWKNTAGAGHRIDLCAGDEGLDF